MKKRSLVCLLLVLCMLVAGCKSEKAADGKDHSLENVKDAGELILGLDASFPPMGFKNDDQEIVGFDIDVATEVCKRMDVKLKLQPISWDAKEQELNTNNIDCIWNGFSYSDQYAKSMTLSKPYMKNTQVAVVLADSDIKTIDDLKGKTVAIQNGSTASLAIDKHKEFKDGLKELIKVDDNVQALMDLKVKGSDCVVLDEVVARYYTGKEKGRFRVLEESLADEQYVIGFRKGETSLCKEVEKQLKEMKADGTLAKISEKWFDKDITIIQ
ncbi:amino acid ABC transporter, amino acid-binding protein [Lachnospiraceae bacterium KM106-2]|nr:amino acid ABC transporter, amino acid-binding protein [Lachnospiraceae bacterium KM106-2]